MRIVFLTHYYPPEVGAPQARIAALAHGLARGGASITVHTCPPHYPDGIVRAPYRNRTLRIGWDGGVRVVRSRIYPAPNTGVSLRLANHASFAASALLTAPATGPADVVVAESPPLFTAGAGIAYARAKRAALVLNVADRWPASAVELGALRSPAAIRAAEWLERTCYRSAAAITVPTAGLAAELDRLSEAWGKVRHLPPAVDLDRFAPPSAACPRGSEGPLRVLYAGTVGLAQGLDTLVEAVACAGPDTVALTIAGDGAESGEVRSRIGAERLSHIRMLGRVPHAGIPGLYAEADAAVVLLRDRRIFDGALPTKLLEALASATPVILAARGEAAALVAASGAGVVVPPEDPAALAEAFRRLARDRPRLKKLGEAGRQRAVEAYGRERSLELWSDVVADAATQAPVNRRSGLWQALGVPRRRGSVRAPAGSSGRRSRRSLREPRGPRVGRG